MAAFSRWAAVAVGLAALVALVLTNRPAPDPGDLSEFGFADAWVRGEVASVESVPCPGADASGPFCIDVVFQIDEGADAGSFVTQSFADEPGSPSFEEGDRVFLSYTAGADPQFAYGYADRDRLGVVLGWAAAFALAVVALGRWKGVAALVGVGISLAVILGYVLPTLLSGGSPLLVSIVAAVVIAAATIWLTHGITPFSGVAFLGTVSALGLTAVLSQLAFGMARITGLATEEAVYLTLLPDVQVSGLVLAGAVLGALGALDDVTVTQASAVFEVRNANPGLDAPALAEAGLRVGRDHIASTVNTLVLAYAGASMPLLVLFVLSNLTPGQVLSSEVIAVEALRTAVGSLGLVAAVPITTWLAARVAVDTPAGTGGGHAH
ncbi:MAG: YibE/F family protein [Acidimicrobiia bacterium]